MEFESSDLLREIEGLGNAISKLQAKLEVVSQTVDTTDEDQLRSRLNQNLGALLDSKFPELCHLLSSISEDLRQLWSIPPSDEDDDTNAEDDDFSEFMIKPDIHEDGEEQIYAWNGEEDPLSFHGDEDPLDFDETDPSSWSSSVPDKSKYNEKSSPRPNRRRKQTLTSRTSSTHAVPNSKERSEKEPVGIPILSRLRKRIPERNLFIYNESVSNNEVNEDDDQEIKSEPQSEEEVLEEDYQPLSKIKKTTQLRNIMRQSKPNGANNICRVCSEILPPEKVRPHTLTQHPADYFILYCSTKISVEEWMKSVNLLPDGTAHSEYPYKCPICSKPYKLRTFVGDHMDTHLGNEELKFSCKCGKSFNSQTGYRDHVRRLHPETAALLAPKRHRRRKRLADDSALKKEVKKPKEPFTCSFCQQVFSRKQHMQTHMKRHYRDKPEAEETLPKIIRKKVDKPKKVTPTLTGEEAFEKNQKKRVQCPICRKVLSSRTYLKSHMRVHDGVKPVKCPECDKSFRTKSLLTDHIEGLHSEEQKYFCEKCDKRFKWRRSYDLHRAAHDDNRKVLCTMCPLRFTQLQALRKHVSNVHNQVRPYPCSSCEMKFKEKHHLRLHIERRHKSRGERVDQVDG